MRRVVSGLGAMGLSIICGCSQDPGQGSQVGQSMAGGGGNGGAAGSLMLGISGGGAGAGGGGAGGSSAGSGGNLSGGAGAGGAPSSAGATPGGSGSGGSKPAGMCTRAPASDADCTDFFEMPSQAYACDDAGAYVTLNGMHGSKCGNGNFVPGAKVGACCPP